MSEKTSTVTSFLPLPLLRAISLTLSLTMLVGDPSWAAGVSDFVHVSFSHDLSSLVVPSKFGTVTDHWNAPLRRYPDTPTRRYSDTQPFVVLIQDLHANIGVQKNIAQIIAYVNHRRALSGIYSEAAFGPSDPSVLRSLPAPSQRKFVDKLLAAGQISGDEIAAVELGHGILSPVRLEGVDDPLLYLANVKAFRDLVVVGPQAARQWKELRDLLLPGAAPQLRRHLELTEKMLELKLLDSEWLEYKEHRDLTPDLSSESRVLGSESGPNSVLRTPYSALSSAVAAAERFYTAAEARNGAMADNLLSRIGVSEFGRLGGTPTHRHAGTVSVLVTGGFHTASIAHILKGRGISFAVVTPVVERLDQDALYERTMVEPPHETVRHIGGLMMGHGPDLAPLARQLGMPDIISWLQKWNVVIPRGRWNFSGRQALKPVTSWFLSFVFLVAMLWSSVARASGSDLHALLEIHDAQQLTQSIQEVRNPDGRATAHDTKAMRLAQSAAIKGNIKIAQGNINSEIRKTKPSPTYLPLALDAKLAKR